ncbi:MAG TPA: hypothetical protein VGO31_04215 [Microbacteriaceae bacterium]|jgi:hypothetical protein|nr:hypothetical protein [Microbacteriaceae bacterium]
MLLLGIVADVHTVAPYSAGRVFGALDPSLPLPIEGESNSDATRDCA